MKGTDRKFNGRPSYPLVVWSGLLEHRERMGSAIWEFIWCLDRITREKDGIGFVSGGAPVKAKQIARDFKTMGDKTVDDDTVRVNLKKLKAEGYLRLRRTPYGQVIEVMNSLKFGIWAPCKRTRKKPDSLTGESRKTRTLDSRKTRTLTRESGKTPIPESGKTPETKKTQQTTRSKKSSFSELANELAARRLAELLLIRRLANLRRLEVKSKLLDSEKEQEASIKRWAPDMEILLRKGYSETDLQELIEWCQADRFWLQNIQSGRKLREKVEDLMIRMKSERVPKAGGPGPVKSLDQELEEVERRRAGVN